ncbi:fluoride efflux transporter CrcB [Thorsellia kenyensis]|uniref:Fluoride-specific ion channel FluC n=1 Tax=Thorsellia kenyensis TaxID=1549888 RepID=A0ABV6CC93_9GAMM
MSLLYHPVIAVFIGGGLGSVLRYFLSISLPTYSKWPFPIATLSANLLGAFIIGTVFAYVSASTQFPSHVKLFLMTGLCGGLTTFSTFSLDLFLFFQKSQWSLLITTLLSNVVLTVIVVSCSFYLTTKLFLNTQ